MLAYGKAGTSRPRWGVAPGSAVHYAAGLVCVSAVAREVRGDLIRAQKAAAKVDLQVEPVRAKA
jgi:hypothetical protein